MADAIVSVVVERVTDFMEDIMKGQIRNKGLNNLVRAVKDSEEEVLKLSYVLKNIRNQLNDADKMRFKGKNIEDWLTRLEDTYYEMNDVFDEWNYAILRFKMEHQSNDAVVARPKPKVCSLIPSSCLCFTKVAVRLDIATKIEIVKDQLDQILEEKADGYNFVISQPTTDLSPEPRLVQFTSSIELEKVHGRDRDWDNIVRKLLPSGGSQEESGLHVLSIVGVGGLGKTTLAELVYNDSRVKEYFELRIWICVSHPFDIVGIAKEIIKSLSNGSCPDTDELTRLLQYLRDSISGKQFLLVLDNVRTKDDTWEPLKSSLKCGRVGSKILVTTRDEMVAKMMDSDICRLEPLSIEDCWFLISSGMDFSQMNTDEFENFQDIGKKIANKCRGLPLAAKVLGRLLQVKNSVEEWKHVLDSETWQLKKANVDLFPHLLLTYNELSPTLRRCFSYCAVFPKGSEIKVENLIENWIALGYLDSNIGSRGCDMEIKGLVYIEHLADRSLFQDFKRSSLDGQISPCKMYDIVHDFAQSLRKNGRVEATGKKICQVCNSSLFSHVKEYRSLFLDKEPPPNLCDCLTSLRVLGITNCNLHKIPEGMENLIHLRWLDFSYNEFSRGDLKTICKLFNLQFLRLKRCELKQIPLEIGNLVHLRHLDLSYNKSIKELPESICGLRELQTLKVDACLNLCGLPEGIDRLIKLKHLHDWNTRSLKQFPQGLARLTGLCTLNFFHGGSGWGKLRLLKNLNRLTGSLELNIRLADDDLEVVVVDAREAELRNKIRIQNLIITFFDYMGEKESSVRMDVIDSLEPHPKLRNLEIWNYKGSKLPGWIASPLNQIRYIKLHGFSHMWALPPLGNLPCLEEICMSGMYGLQLVGREFLGIKTTTAARDIDIESSSSSSSTYNIGFPKLKKLTFRGCPHWKDWADITAEEEESAAVSLMPCLTELTIQFCKGLTALPIRLLRKATSLEKLDISYSTKLQQRYGDKDGSDWKSISQNNPHLRIELRRHLRDPNAGLLLNSMFSQHLPNFRQ